VNAEFEPAAVRIVVMGSKPMAVLLEMRVGKCGKNLRRRINRQIGFLDAGNGRFADLED